MKTGLYAELHLDPRDPTGKNYVLCFPGTGAAGNITQQWKYNIDQATGKKKIPPPYEAGLRLATELQEVISKQGGTLSLAGHSLGGGIANYCGFMLDIPSVAFNAAPLGQEIGRAHV